MQRRRSAGRRWRESRPGRCMHSVMAVPDRLECSSSPILASSPLHDLAKCLDPLALQPCRQSLVVDAFAPEHPQLRFGIAVIVGPACTALSLIRGRRPLPRR